MYHPCHDRLLRHDKILADFVKIYDFQYQKSFFLDLPHQADGCIKSHIGHKVQLALYGFFHESLEKFLPRQSVAEINTPPGLRRDHIFSNT